MDQQQQVADATFRANVIAEMERQGMTRHELAQRLDVKRPVVSKVLNGRAHVTVPRAERIAIALGVELWELLRPRENLERTA